MSLPLQGFTIVAIEQAVAAPLATRNLADLGARVIKVERIDGGDFARGYDHVVHGTGAHFVWLNRGKESIAVDLKSAEGVSIVRRLIDRADVFLQNLAPGAADRLGLGADELRSQRPELITGLVLVGPFVRNPSTGAVQRLMLRAAMARPWAAMSWKAYLPKLYAGQRPADFAIYRNEVVAALRRPGYAKAFSLTTRTDHGAAEAELSKVSTPAMIVMGTRDPDFPDPQAEADWIAAALKAEVLMVPDAGHYPQSQRADVVTPAIVRFLAQVNPRA